MPQNNDGNWLPCQGDELCDGVVPEHYEKYPDRPGDPGTVCPKHSLRFFNNAMFETVDWERPIVSNN